MSKNASLRARVSEMAKELNISQGRTTLAASVKGLVDKTLYNWGAVAPVDGGGIAALESYDNVNVKRAQSFDALADADPRELMKGLNELGMSGRHTVQITEDCMSMFDGSFSPLNVLGETQALENYAPLSRVVGRTAAASLSRSRNEVGVEAFGDDINRLASDDRLTMNLVIMRPWDNIMDKALARVSESSPVVTIRVPSPEAYDWAKTQDTESNFGDNTYRLRDLYRNPSPVNSAPQKVVARTANDSGSVLWNSTTTHYKVNKQVNLKKLSLNSSVITHAHADRTDLIADGGVIDSVIVSVKPGTDPAEFFKINTRSMDLAMFTITPSTRSSGQRQVILDCVLPITSATKEWDGSSSAVATALTDAKILVKVRITATLDIKTGELQANGTASATLVGIGGAAVSGGTQTYFGTLVFDVVAYSADLYFDEENQRKANLAVWMNYYEIQYMVPRSRVYFTEYSLTQSIDENAVAATSSIVALGNGRRGLDIVVNALNDVSSALEFAELNPEVASYNSVDEQSFASALVKPTVVKTVLDFDVEDVNTMNESTRLVEIHGRFRARFLSMCTILFAKSLMLNQYKGGETPVIKAWVHSSIADLVIGITDYHPDLKDAASTATGADYSMVLPNGYRLDVIKSNLDCLQQRIYAVPVIESDMASVLSAASIRDCGTVTTNYSPTNYGATVRRVATTTREIVMMSNRVGIMLEVKGLNTQIGDVGFGALALSANFSESLSV